jgi:phosphoadenosine phosphosulfate reductase
MRVTAQNQVILGEPDGAAGTLAGSGSRLPSVIDLAPIFAAKQAAALNLLLSDASPEEVIGAALGAVDYGRFAIVSSFGTESAVLLAAAAAVDRTIPVLLVDTGYLFPETLAYRDLLQQRLGLTDIRSLRPDADETLADDPEGDLFQRDPDGCCELRKVRPLGTALNGFDAWANGRKRYQGADRAAIPIVEGDGQRLKFNPLSSLSRGEIVARFRGLDLPAHPLEKHGFASIGCMPCTSRVLPGEDPRAGRWRGRGKVECGIHTGPLRTAAGV